MISMNEYLHDDDFLASAPYATLRTLGLGFIDAGVRGGVYPIVDSTPLGAMAVGLHRRSSKCVVKGDWPQRCVTKMICLFGVNHTCRGILLRDTLQAAEAVKILITNRKCGVDRRFLA